MDRTTLFLDWTTLILDRTPLILVGTTLFLDILFVQGRVWLGVHSSGREKGEEWHLGRQQEPGLELDPWKRAKSERLDQRQQRTYIEIFLSESA